MTNNSLEAKLNTLTDDELIKELAAAYESKRRIILCMNEDADVVQLKDSLKEATQPYKDRETYFKKYIRALIELANLRNLNLRIKDMTETPVVEPMTLSIRSEKGAAITLNSNSFKKLDKMLKTMKFKE
jgi:hypothetical protein